MIDQDRLAEKILAYMRHKGYTVCNGPGEYNIVYLEGADADGRPNADTIDVWNDRRLLIRHDTDGTARMVLNAMATTEPGLAATHSTAARKRGGVARIAIGQHTAWKMGFHKQLVTHPALVQTQPLTVHRDYNRDGRRTGDRLDVGLFGINQHSTRPGIRPKNVGRWSEGCLVGQTWEEHLNFIDLLRTDVRFQADKDFVFTTTVIDTTDFAKWLASEISGMIVAPRRGVSMCKSPGAQWRTGLFSCPMGIGAGRRCLCQ